MKNGGINPRDIGYINAHATSTHAGDGREALAIANIFGDYRVPVTSTKSQTGHEMWMAGASELIYSMLMMKNDFIAKLTSTCSSATRSVSEVPIHH